MVKVIWNGSEDEAARFITALAKDCSCDPHSKKVCPSHYAMAHEQRVCYGVPDYVTNC